MRPRPPPPQRKRRTREHVIADLSVNHVERLIYRCGWVAYRMSPDYGVDLLMETFNTSGEVENGLVALQLKATDTLRVLASKQAIPIPLDWRDVLFWLNEDMPGILIIYDAVQERAWWAHLQQAIRDRLGQRPHRGVTLTLRVPLANTLNEDAIRQFAHLREAAQMRMERTNDQKE